MRWYLRSKIHRATVTEARIDYIGSITIDKSLINRAGFHPGEKVSVWDITNGARLETYVIEGEEGTGIICINGAAAKKVNTGDQVIIAGFELTDAPVKPNIVLVDGNNRFVKYIQREDEIE